MRFFKTLFSAIACSLIISVASAQRVDLASYVNPFMGTGDHGHTYPGAVLPHGMVQLSPDTRMDNWDGSSGYHESDKTIMGFSHTHLSGTGSAELCDILFMPMVGDPILVAGDENKPKSGYRSSYQHKNEEASPGYYKVLLDDSGVSAELTATERTGFHRYTFPKSDQSDIIIDLKHRGHMVNSTIQVLNDSTITGFTLTTRWAIQKHIYFYAKFSKSFSSFGISLNDTLVKKITKAEGKNIKAFVSFKTKSQEQILVKVGISAVSVQGAKDNLEAENTGWNFQKIKDLARADWNAYLSKISVEGGTEKQRRIFYTSLYHAALAPNLFMDKNGDFRGTDHLVHKPKGFTNYTIFSLWDVFRTQMPLLTIIEPARMNDYIQSLIEMYRLGGRLARFEIHGTLSENMIGYHSLPLILDAYVKGIRDFDVPLAYKGMQERMENIPYYNNLGFIPGDIEGTGGSVAQVMEYAYNYWCLAEMARILNKKEDFLRYQQRAQFYKNHFDASTGFMRPKNKDYSWVQPFDPAEPTGYFVEGNAFQYSAFVPQDVNGLIKMLGGDAKFETWLDTLFTHKSRFDKNVVDASGLMGQYAHGNEPSHEIAYLYNYAGAAPKTQKYVRNILNNLYDDAPAGLSGNEDCGQISAWYVMSAMGIYPVLPGDPTYNIGTPLFDKVTLNLENGKHFTIKANKVSESNFYIQSARLNGQPYTKSWISHSAIAQGGELSFEMGPHPNASWGTSKADRPATKKLASAVSMPFYKIKEDYFIDKATITLGSETKDAKIYYTIDGTLPTVNSKVYSSPIVLDKTSDLKFFAKKEGLLTTTVVEVKVEKLGHVDRADFKDYSSLKVKTGLRYKYYEDHVMHVAELDPLKPKKSGVTSGFNIDERENDGLFAFDFWGYIKIPTDGVYTFYLATNDGGVLYLDDKPFISADGPHTATPSSRMVWIKAGTYKIQEKYFQMGGAFTNILSWKGPGISKQVISPAVLFYNEN
jgi:predicted alpha-1,2-mannosidase